MRRLLLALALLLTIGVSSASAAVAVTGVTGNGGNNANTATVATGALSSASTAGNILVAFISWDNGTTATISSVTGGGTSVTWTSKIAKFTDSRHGQNAQVYIGTITTGGTTAVTANFSGNCFAKTILVIEVSGQNTTQFDATATSTTAAGTAVTIAITSTQASCLILGAAFDDGGTNTISAAAGMTQATSNNGSGNWGALHYRTTNPGSGATSVDWTFSGTDDAVVAAVSVAPSGGGGCTAPPNQLMMTGVGNCKGLN